MLALARILSALLVILAPLAAPAHEFWLDVRDYQVAPGENIVAHLVNGQNFSGVELAWFAGRIARAEWHLSEETGPLTGRSGDRPAVTLPAPGDGLVRLVYQSTPSQLTYKDWEKFRSFADGKGHAWALARHHARGLPATGFTERYTRFVKALVAVGDGAGSDAPAGMEAELVALSNPYTDPPQTGLRVEMRYRGTPLPAQRIDIFDKDANGRVEKTHATTDATGRALIPLVAGHRYLLDAVVLREAEGADPWESLWASLTFAVPQ